VSAPDNFIAVICGLKSEAAAVCTALGADRRVRIGVSGANAARAEASAAQMCRQGARAVLSIGISGGLDPALKPGDLVIGENVIADDAVIYASDRQLLAAIISAHSGKSRDEREKHRFVSLFGADEIVSSVAAKKKLRETRAAIAVDMESHGAAKAAAGANVPFLAIRAIADPANRALPRAALHAVAADGSTRVAATLFAAMREPKQFPMLIRLGRDSRVALKTLRRDLGPLFCRLFVALNL